MPPVLTSPKNPGCGSSHNAPLQPLLQKALKPSLGLPLGVAPTEACHSSSTPARRNVALTSLCLAACLNLVMPINFNESHIGKLRGVDTQTCLLQGNKDGLSAVVTSRWEETRGFPSPPGKRGFAKPEENNS